MYPYILIQRYGMKLQNVADISTGNSYDRLTAPAPPPPTPPKHL